MIEEEIMKTSVKEKIKLDKAYLNYHEIIDKKLPYKFAYLDDWMLKQSKLLLNETNNIENNEKTVKKTKNKTYSRGTIIKCDFGVGLGSEMSQSHFAIVLNNYDNPQNNVLTIVPLTSKKNKYNLDLGTLIIDTLVKKVEIEMVKIGIEEELENNVSVEKKMKIKKLETLLSYYKSSVKNTYACCSLITTISKTRISPSINEYDIIGRSRCSSDVMDKIDNEIKNRIIKNCN